MRLMLPEPPIELYKDGFDGHDKLGRKKTGATLSELVEKVQDPLVIALDGAWGCGKSFFLKCWVGEHLKREGNTAQTIYFDAFVHDFLDDPIIALTGVIAERLEESEDTPAKSAWRKARQAAPALARAILRVGVSVGTAGIVTNAGDIIDAATDTIGDELQGAVADFWKKEEGKRAAMETFRDALVELTAPDGDRKPTRKLIVVVDELDRCRPDYALSLLEIIKHFFNVDGVHFVLGVNLDELENSVRARYGDRTDARKYLQKFITLTMVLSMDGNASGGNIKELTKYLETVVASMEIDQNTVNELQGFLTLPNISAKATIRDVQRVLTRVVLLPNDFGDSYWPLKLTVLTGIFLEVLDQPLYLKYRAASASQKDVFSFLGIGTPDDADGGFEPYLWHAVHIYLADQPEKASLELVKRVMMRSGLGTPKAHISKVVFECLDRFTISD
ncbi:MAG: hypothetical protein COC12_09880 [Rhodobacteraceae bacterium]|nr:MAG: hypothetical protein COC12_09880 [Paracoccaceae bacterium]